MRTAVAVVAVIVALIVGAGVGYLGAVGNSSTKEETVTVATTQTSFSTLTSASTTLTQTSLQTSVVTTTIGESPISVASVETAAVPIAGSPRTIALNPNASRVYVADWFSNHLTVINAQTHSVMTTVLLPADSNNGIAIDYKTGMVYALVSGGVVEVNGTTNAVVRELSMNLGAGALALDPGLQTVYGTVGGPTAKQSTTGRLLGLDVTTGAVVANISLGYWANSLVADPHTHMIYAAGCAGSFVCGSEMSIVNGTSKSLVATVRLGNVGYPRITMDFGRNVVFVSGGAQLTALSGTNGRILYNADSQVCGPFDSVAISSSPNQLLAISLDTNYLLAYDETSGVLVNMYSFSGTPQYVAFNPGTGEVYVTNSGQLLTFKNSASLGHVNGNLTGLGINCPLP